MDDLISRQEVLDAINKCMDIFVNNLPTMVYKSEAYKAVSEVPSAQPEPQWIPVSERLPKHGKDVLVTRYYDGRADHNKSCRYVEVASCCEDDNDVAWNSYSDEYKMSPQSHAVVAWMPLPEPYTEDKDNETD